MTTGKTIALTRWTFVGKIMSLLFSMLSRLVITFLPRSKRLLISWLQSPLAMVYLQISFIILRNSLLFIGILQCLAKLLTILPQPSLPACTKCRDQPEVQAWCTLRFLCACMQPWECVLNSTWIIMTTIIWINFQYHFLVLSIYPSSFTLLTLTETSFCTHNLIPILYFLILNIIFSKTSFWKYNR